MHWGHAVSDDLLHWEYLPCALAPDRYYDQDGVYSGSAIMMPDGRMMLMYTGRRIERERGRAPLERQVQCLAFGDGVDFEKYEGNPVITAYNLPAFASPVDFRDPKIFRLPNGTYSCITGSKTEEADGQILYFTSPDALHWKFERVFIR